MGRPDEAVEHLKRATKLNPRDERGSLRWPRRLRQRAMTPARRCLPGSHAGQRIWRRSGTGEAGCAWRNFSAGVPLSNPQSRTHGRRDVPAGCPGALRENDARRGPASRLRDCHLGHERHRHKPPGSRSTGCAACRASSAGCIWCLSNTWRSSRWPRRWTVGSIWRRSMSWRCRSTNSASARSERAIGMGLHDE